MGKIRNNKLRSLNKITQKQKNSQGTSNISNKIIKKKQNAEKKLTFKKEVLLKEAVRDDTVVKKLNTAEVILKNLFKSPEKKKKKLQDVPKQPKIKPVEKHKKRQKTQINDKKLLLKLMKSRK